LCGWRQEAFTWLGGALEPLHSLFFADLSAGFHLPGAPPDSMNFGLGPDLGETDQA
jgi:hypothetical protein